MALTSDDVNLMIYRYLFEAGAPIENSKFPLHRVSKRYLSYPAGFTHSAYVFGCESTVSRSGASGKDLPIGALVTFIQKGFQLMELEANLNENGTDVYGEYTPISASEILSKDIAELKAALREAKDQRATDPLATGPVEVPATSLSLTCAHSGEVLCMSCCQATGALATGGADGSLKLFQDAVTDAANPSALCPLPLNSQPSCLEWSADGRLLASGTTTGQVHIYSTDGSLSVSLQIGGHGEGEPVLAVRWAKGDNCLIASGGADGVVIVWDPSSGLVRKKYDLHLGAVLDIDWRTNTELAVGTQSGAVCYLKVDEERPCRVWWSQDGGGVRSMEHEQEEDTPMRGPVNSISWDETGRLLASAGSDGTVRIWGLHSDRPEVELLGHKREVTRVNWGSVGGTQAIASASADGSIRVWDSHTLEHGGPCSHVLDSHEGDLHCLSWSPVGEYVASGDSTGKVNVWSVRSGRLVRSFEGPGCAHELVWLDTSLLIAACVSATAAVVAQLK